MKFFVSTFDKPGETTVPGWEYSPMWREFLQETLEEELSSATVAELVRIRRIIADCLDGSREEFVAAHVAAKETGSKLISAAPFEGRLRFSASAEDTEFILGRVFPAIAKRPGGHIFVVVE